MVSFCILDFSVEPSADDFDSDTEVNDNIALKISRSLITKTARPSNTENVKLSAEISLLSNNHKTSIPNATQLTNAGNGRVSLDTFNSLDVFLDTELNNYFLTNDSCSLKDIIDFDNKTEIDIPRWSPCNVVLSEESDDEMNLDNILVNNSSPKINNSDESQTTNPTDSSNSLCKPQKDTDCQKSISSNSSLPSISHHINARPTSTGGYSAIDNSTKPVHSAISDISSVTSEIRGATSTDDTVTENVRKKASAGENINLEFPLQEPLSDNSSERLFLKTDSSRNYDPICSTYNKSEFKESKDSSEISDTVSPYGINQICSLSNDTHNQPLIASEESNPEANKSDECVETDGFYSQVITMSTESIFDSESNVKSMDCTNCEDLEDSSQHNLSSKSSFEADTSFSEPSTEVNYGANITQALTDPEMPCLDSFTECISSIISPIKSVGDPDDNRGETLHSSKNEELIKLQNESSQNVSFPLTQNSLSVLGDTEVSQQQSPSKSKPGGAPLRTELEQKVTESSQNSSQLSSSVSAVKKTEIFNKPTSLNISTERGLLLKSQQQREIINSSGKVLFDYLPSKTEVSQKVSNESLVVTSEKREHVNSSTTPSTSFSNHSFQKSTGSRPYRFRNNENSDNVFSFKQKVTRHGNNNESGSAFKTEISHQENQKFKNPFLVDIPNRIDSQNRYFAGIMKQEPLFSQNIASCKYFSSNQPNYNCMQQKSTQETSLIEISIDDHGIILRSPINGQKYNVNVSTDDHFVNIHIPKTACNKQFIRISSTPETHRAVHNNNHGFSRRQESFSERFKSQREDSRQWYSNCK